MRIAWIALALMAASHVAADSNPPAPTPPKPAQIDQDRAEHKGDHSAPSDKLGENSALAGQARINSQVNKTQTSDHADNGNDHSLEKGWSLYVVPGLTLLLLAAQVRIYWRQRELMAQQADIMQAGLDMERPHVYGAVSKPGLKVILGTGLERSALELCIYNFGRTPALLTRLEYTISMAQHGGIAPAIDPNIVGGRELPVGTVAVSRDPYFESTNLRIEFFDVEDAIVESKQSVWIVGFVRYADIFGNHYISGFGLVFDPIGGRFVRRGDEKYNYARKEETSSIPSKSA
jgi:hypothetical protein